jgi:hypothetical protein
MAAGATYEPIATQTLGSASSTITFSSISGSYTDLVLVATFTQSTAGQSARIVLNGDTATNYSLTEIRGNGTSAASSRGSSMSNGYYGYYSDGSTSVPTVAIVSLMNYANTTTYKTWLSRSGASDRATEALVGLWRSTSAITTIALSIDAGATYSTGSTFTLYGIAAA